MRYFYLKTMADSKSSESTDKNLLLSADNIKTEIEVPIENFVSESQECVVCLTNSYESYEISSTHTIATVTSLDTFLSKFTNTELINEHSKFICKRCLDLINNYEQAELEYLKAKDDFETIIKRNPLFSMPQPISLDHVKNETWYFDRENLDSSDSENEPLARVKNKISMKMEDLDDQYKDTDIVEPIIEVSYPENDKVFEGHEAEKSVDSRLWTTGTVPDYKSKKDQNKDSKSHNKKGDSKHIERPICDYCHRQFQQKSNLIKHLRLHTGEVPYACNQCQRRFSRRDSLTKHLRTHSGEKRHECDICKRKFKEKSQIISHTRTHTGEEPYKCHICERPFKDRNNLRTHMRTHTGEEPFQCNICPKGFKQKVHLDSHIRTHTGEKPFQCTLCERRFKDKCILKKHFRTHTGETPYECEICHRKFKQSTNLKLHLRLHTGEQPFECKVCKCRFRQKSNLTVHSRVHGEKIDPPIPIKMKL